MIYYIEQTKKSIFSLDAKDVLYQLKYINYMWSGLQKSFKKLAACAPVRILWSNVNDTGIKLPMTILLFVTIGLHSFRPMARMPTHGGIRTGVPYFAPIEPMFVSVKVGEGI